MKARRDQDERANALAHQFDQRRRQFYAQVAPILVMLMDRYGAKAIFDENSVLLADQSLNITQAVIGEIDARAATPHRRGPLRLRRRRTRVPPPPTRRGPGPGGSRNRRERRRELRWGSRSTMACRRPTSPRSSG